MPASPSLVAILIAPSPTAAMLALHSVRAIAGVGLEGDRYALGTGTFSQKPQRADGEVTLIEAEEIAAFAQESGLPFLATHARRNLVTTGVRLNDLVGHEFTIGAVRLRGHRLCEPCNYLAKTTWPETLRGLVHRGGLRAQILNDSELHVGDLIEIGCSDAVRPFTA